MKQSVPINQNEPTKTEIVNEEITKKPIRTDKIQMPVTLADYEHKKKRAEKEDPKSTYEYKMASKETLIANQ